MKTIAKTGALLILLTAPVPATADLHMTFAGCVGRMSAHMEHAWLVNEEPEPYVADRMTFLSLLEATLPAGAARDALARRIDAKMAQASLLTIATFSDQPERAAMARERAVWHVAQCSALLLDS